MFDIIIISITNINLPKYFLHSLFAITKLLSYFNKITHISYAFVYTKEQTNAYGVFLSLWPTDMSKY